MTQAIWEQLYCEEGFNMTEAEEYRALIVIEI